MRRRCHWLWPSRVLILIFLGLALIGTFYNIHQSQSVLMQQQAQLLEEQEYALDYVHGRITSFLENDKKIDASTVEAQDVALKQLRGGPSTADIFRFPSENSPIAKELTNNNSTTTSRRKLVWHIGPMKTGSTTLQVSAEKDTRLLALQDGWLYPSEWRQMVYSQTDTRPCRNANMNDPIDKEELMFFRQTKNITEGRTLCEFFNAKRWNVIEKVLRNGTDGKKYKKMSLSKTRSNIFFIDEMFGVMRDTPKRWELIKKVFSPFDVKIVLTYRRYFEWFISYYTQSYGSYGPIIEEELRNVWPSKDPSTKEKRYNNRIKPITEYHELLKTDETSMFMKRWNIKHDGMKHPLEAQYDRFASHFPNIQIFNYHFDPRMVNTTYGRKAQETPTNLVAEFYDQVLGATNAANHRRWNGLPTINAGESKLLPYDMIAIAAYDEGWIDINHKYNMREAVARAVKNHWVNDLKKKFQDLPLICLNATQQHELMEWSLTMERRIIPEWAATHEKEHHKAFDKYIQNKNFCSVDVQQFIRLNKGTEGRSWRSWFQSLKLPPPPKPKSSLVTKQQQRQVLKGLRPKKNTLGIKGRHKKLNHILKLQRKQQKS